MCYNIIGNIDKNNALDLVKIVESTFPFKPLPRDRRCVRTPYEIPAISTISSSSTTSSSTSSSSNRGSNSPSAAVPAGYRLANTEPNTNDSNSAVTFYFQQPSRAMKAYLLVELLSDVIEQPFYNTLRTQQQLGYIVYSGLKSRQGVYNLLFVAQSNIVDGGELTARVEKFISDTTSTLLPTLTQEEFDTYKEGLIVKKSEPDRRLTGQASRFLGEILVHDMLMNNKARAQSTAQTVTAQAKTANNSTSSRYITEEEDDVPGVNEPDFDRYEREIEVSEKLTLSEFIAFAMSFLQSTSPTRRLLISQVTSSQKPTSSSGSTSSTGSGGGSKWKGNKLNEQLEYIELTEPEAFVKGLNTIL